ncbi:MAG: NDP-sugar synthase [Chloroflexi bacterium]|nr:NDP-sugar synthase [Chloroflexota bacterium]
MKAVILVGGEGTRLRPLTCNIPKPMVPILNRPFLEHVVEYLRGHGVRELFLALCYMPDKIQKHFGDGRGFGISITYAMEESPLGTAGAVKNLEEHLNDTFFVLNGDTFTDLDLSAMLAFHKQRKARATIAVTPVENPTVYGVVETNSQGEVHRFVEKPSWEAVTTNMVNAGCYLLEPELLQHIPPRTYFMFEYGLFPALLKLGTPLYAYPSRGYWIDIGTPQKYLQVHKDLLLSKAIAKILGEPTHKTVWLGEGCQIHSTAEVSGPVLLGEGCVLGPRSRIKGPAVLGPGCIMGESSSVEEAVLWRGVRIGKGVNIRKCVVGENASIGDSAWIIEGPVIGDNASVGSGNKLKNDFILWPGKTLKPDSISF